MDTPCFAAGTLERAAHLRGTGLDQWRNATARVLPLAHLKPLVGETGALHFLPASSPLMGAGVGEVLFLGLDGAGDPLFTVDVTHLLPADSGPDGGFHDTTSQTLDGVSGAAFVDLRQIMAALDPWEAEVAATARALLAWHGTHQFCAKCGGPSRIAQGGWERHCDACGASHFPRTDPVVIMLVTQGNSVLLGRNANWPEGMFSLLAGFVEPGEPIEAAVRRETFEEAGIRVGRVRYLASQPWTFPASLMLGCIGEATTHDITVDPDELEAAMWVSRERLMRAMAGLDPEISPSRQGAIAQFLMRKWLADRLD